MLSLASGGELHRIVPCRFSLLKSTAFVQTGFRRPSRFDGRERVVNYSLDVLAVTKLQ